MYPPTPKKPILKRKEASNHSWKGKLSKDIECVPDNLEDLLCSEAATTFLVRSLKEEIEF
ncbi:MAG: hypothetical protein ABFS18_12335 [Thermodesulfobacteriota bacterium]